MINNEFKSNNKDNTAKESPSKKAPLAICMSTKKRLDKYRSSFELKPSITDLASMIIDKYLDEKGISHD